MKGAGRALITGAASGIGRAVARKLAARGIDGLALLDRDAVGLAEAAEELRKSGPQVTTATLDVADEAALTQAFEEAARSHDGLDYVLNNAAIMTGLPVFPEASLEKIDEVLAINLRAVIVGTKLAHGVLAASGGGSILNTASGAAKIPLPNDPIYAATKAAVVMLTRSCAQAFAQDRIRINAICPGITDTPILEQNGNGVRPAALAEVAMLQPEEVAEAAIDLLTHPERTGEAPSVVPGTA